MRGSGRGVRYALLVLGVLVLALAGYAGYEFYPRFGLPPAQGAGLFILAAAAGIASFFSPCAFPLLITLLARETGGVAGPAGRRLALRRGLGFAAALSVGAAAFLLLVGAGIALGGAALFGGVTFRSVAGRVIRVAAGLFLLLLGLVQIGRLPSPMHVVGSASRALLRRQAEVRRKSPAAGFVMFGFGYLLAGFG